MPIIWGDDKKEKPPQIKKISKGPKKHQTEETKEPLAKIDVDELDVAPCNPRWQRNTDGYFKQDDGRKKKPRCNVLISGFPFLLIFFRRRAKQHSVWHDVAVVTIMLLDRGPSGGQCPVSVGDMSATWVPTQKCPSLGELLEGVMGMFELTNTNELCHLCHGPNRSYQMYHVILIYFASPDWFSLHCDTVTLKGCSSGSSP